MDDLGHAWCHGRGAAAGGKVDHPAIEGAHGRCRTGGDVEKICRGRDTAWYLRESILRFGCCIAVDAFIPLKTALPLGPVRRIFMTLIESRGGGRGAHEIGGRDDVLGVLAPG